VKTKQGLNAIYTASFVAQDMNCLHNYCEESVSKLIVLSTSSLIRDVVQENKCCWDRFGSSEAEVYVIEGDKVYCERRVKGRG
jgi:hypothetical protein